MITIEDLRRYGANVEEGLSRCLNNEGFYLRMVGKALDDNHFEQLKESVEKNDLQGAFEAAHALKGIFGNLSLTPLFDPVSEITELLRNKADVDYLSYLQKIEKEFLELKELAEH